MRVLTLSELALVAGGNYGDAPDYVVDDPGNTADCSDIVVTAQINGDTTNWDSYSSVDVADYSPDSTDATGSSATTYNPTSALPQGYHASPLDPDHKHYMVKDGDPDNKLELTPQWQSQVNNGHTNWAGVAYDLAVIATGAIGGAGDGARVVIGIAGGLIGGASKP